METSTQNVNQVVPQQREITPIELWEWQVPHFQRVCKILKSWHSYLDTSPMGAGKTIVTLAICAVFKLNLAVVAPLSTLSMWEETAATYGVRLISTMTYQKLAGTKKNGCNHPFIYRSDDSYRPTDYLRQWISAGTLFVFDEMHNLKNGGTAQLNAAHAISRTVVNMNCGSRIALLSATPCDKKEHAQSVHKILGVIRNPRLYNYDQSTNEYELLGISELFSYCDTIDRVTSSAIYGPVRVTRTTSNQLCYDLYVGVVKGALTSCMPKPDIAAQKDAKNGYYEMPEEDVDTIREAEAALRNATKYREDTGTVEIRTGSWGEITKAQVGLENGKLRTLVRLAQETLNADPNNKVILYVWYIKSIKYLRQALAGNNPLVMFGETKPEERDAIIRLFQQDDTAFRLIISNAKVGGIGISLDDRSGTKPRFMFMVPTYNFIDLHQSSGRIYRGTTKSDATVRFVYSKAFRGETSILHAISRKTEITKSMLYDEANILFPGDYDLYIEGEGVKPGPNHVNYTVQKDGNMKKEEEDETDEDFALRLQMEEFLNI